MGWKELDQTGRDVLIELYNRATLTADELPYTPEFEAMVAEFNRRTGRSLSQHDFWRALSSARKSSSLGRKER